LPDSFSLQVIDMPPGTGDIHLTVAQSAPITGAVIVTTPHQLAIADVVKGVQMFKELKIPTLAVVSIPI
jgi:ATP-binding protein involved in chromosome partitioning